MHQPFCLILRTPLGWREVGIGSAGPYTPLLHKDGQVRRVMGCAQSYGAGNWQSWGRAACQAHGLGRHHRVGGFCTGILQVDSVLLRPGMTYPMPCVSMAAAPPLQST